MSKSLDKKGITEAKLACDEDDAKVLFFACTIWSGLLEKVQNSVSAKILDPVQNTVNFAEMLAKI
jgi:Asp/Glu/hydantoin racemase